MWYQYRNLGVQRPRRCLVDAAGFLAVLAVVAAAILDGDDSQDGYDDAGDGAHNQVDLVVSTGGALPVSYTHLTLPTKRIV